MDQECTTAGVADSRGRAGVDGNVVSGAGARRSAVSFRGMRFDNAGSEPGLSIVMPTGRP